jgi:hypothetical protein
MLNMANSGRKHKAASPARRRKPPALFAPNFRSLSGVDKWTTARAAAQW